MLGGVEDGESGRRGNLTNGLMGLALTAPLAALAGEAARYGVMGWLGVPVALGGLMLCAWRWEKGKGWAEGLGRFGRAVYGGWCLTLAALTAASAVDALGRTDYPAGEGWVLALALAAVVWYLLGKGPEAAERWGRVMGAGCRAVIGGFLLLALVGEGRITVSYAAEEWRKGAAGAMPVLGCGCIGALGALRPRAEKKRGAVRGMVGWCAAALGLELVVFATLGAQVAAEAPLPFYLALQGLGFGGTFQRLEAVGTAVWAVSHVALAVVCGIALAQLSGRKEEARWATAAAVALGGALMTNEVVRPFGTILYVGNVILGGVVPVARSFRRKGIAKKVKKGG